jgi:hypothetical protein
MKTDILTERDGIVPSTKESSSWLYLIIKIKDAGCKI